MGVEQNQRGLKFEYALNMYNLCILNDGNPTYVSTFNSFTFNTFTEMYKDTNYETYFELKREIQSTIRTAKIEHLNKQCQEIERLQALHDGFNLLKRFKKALGVYYNQYRKYYILTTKLFLRHT